MAPTTFEQVLEQVGNKGRHQNLLYWLFVVPINYLIPWMVMVPIFQTSTPDHWCRVPGKPAGVTSEEWKSLTVPRTSEDAEKYESCKQYDVEVSDLLALLNGTQSTLGGSIATLAASLNASFGITECQDGWDYDHTHYDHTLTTNQNWVCGRASLASTWLSVGVAGNVAGTLLFNSLSDIIGRRPVLVMTVLTYAVFGVTRLYVAQSTWALMLTTFLASTPFPAILEQTLIIAMEQVAPGLRSRITSTSFMLWMLGSCTVPLLAWLTRDWQLLGLITTLPFFLFGLGWWLLPESPRWLLSRNRLKECEDHLKNIARRNGKVSPSTLEETLAGLSKIHNTTDKNYGALQLCQYRVVRIRTFLLTACYTLNNFFYYGLTYNITNVSGNEFINFFLMSITELPSNLLGWWASKVIGRRWTAAGCFFLASTFTLATAFVSVTDSEWGPIALLLLSKVFNNTSFLIVYIQCAEIYPTTHRSCGTGLSSLVSSCFGVLVPYVSYVSKYGVWIPYAILVLVGMCGFVCSSFLPETLHMDLPQSLLDAENFLTTEKFWSYKGVRLRTKRLTISPTAASKGKDQTSVIGLDSPAFNNEE